MMLRIGCCLGLGLLIIGCDPASNSTSKPGAPAAAAQSTGAPAKPDAPAAGPKMVEQQSTPLPPPKAAEPAQAAKPAAAPALPAKPAEEPKQSPPVANTVTLGTDELTQGIPGTGTLTVAQIQAWIAKPENHQTLSVKLPEGLSVGQDAIKGIDKNPLTRAKIELGRQLYFDKRLSADSTVSCADCHHPDEGYARHTQFGVGIKGQTGGRNSPVSYNRILSDLQFWDGRAGSLEEQAVGPIQNPIEMGNTHEAAVATLKKVPGYVAQFEKVFSDGITIGNVGKAIASFERVIVSGPAPFDFYEPLLAMQKNYQDELKDLAKLKSEDPELHADYLKRKAASDAHPVSESARRGRDIFFSQKGGCTACHVGPNLTDEKYHNLGVGMDKKDPDLGRYVVTKADKEKGAFKTPTVRNVALSAPYMHDGSQKTLLEVVQWYNKGGHANPQLDDGVRKLNLTSQEEQDLVAFMEACTGSFPKVERGRLPE